MISKREKTASGTCRAGLPDAVAGSGKRIGHDLMQPGSFLGSSNLADEFGEREHEVTQCS